MTYPNNTGMDATSASDAGGPARLTVSEFTRAFKNLIEDEFPFVAIEGEISNYVHHSSGHRYFSLKDASSQLKCVMFKWQANKLPFVPEAGAKVIAFGNPTVYEPRGEYQLNIQRMQPLGRGDLLARLEELKAMLESEGVFGNERPIPRFPNTIGVVTSPTGAAVRDIISVLSRRAPYAKIILRPALVQGEGAASDIAQAIRELNEYSDAELLIVGRGGGSIEDLWSFNEEQVAREIHASNIPIISAVGHETDFTLADFAADLRAPTPSAAAELAVRDSVELKETVRGLSDALGRGVLGTVDRLSQRVDLVVSGFSPGRFIQNLELKSQRIDEYSVRMRSALLETLSASEKKAEGLMGKLQAMNPRSVLDRGYSIVYREEDDRIVDDTALVSGDERIRVELANGTFKARVES